MASSYVVMIFFKKDHGTSKHEELQIVDVQVSDKETRLSHHQPTSDESVPRWGLAAIQGRREAMEDRFAIQTNIPVYHEKANSQKKKQIHLFGVFDGHGGSEAADFVSSHLFSEILNQNVREPFLDRMEDDNSFSKQNAFTKVFKDLDDQFAMEFGESSLFQGTTGVVLMLASSSSVDPIDGRTIKKRKAFVANVGDSRAILYKNNRVEPLSIDNKPHRRDESQRIQDAGGLVGFEGVPRIYLGTSGLYGQGGLAVSRAFGDTIFKDHRFIHNISRPLVSVVPEFEERLLDGENDSKSSLQYLTIGGEAQFILLASDGLWDVLSNEHVCDLVLKFMQEYYDTRTNSVFRSSNHGQDEVAQIVAQKLVDHAYTLGSDDNITALLVLL